LFQKNKHITQAMIAVYLSLQPYIATPVYAGSENPTNINNFSAANYAQLALAAQHSVNACSALECESSQLFDERVQRLGHGLVITAYELFPNLQQTVPEFEFEVVDKAIVGTSSNTTGNIILFRGLQNLALSDEALSFIIAREMGHAIAQHHSKNYSTRLLISAAVSLVFPVAGILSFSTTASQAASSATSYVGSQVALDSVQASQLAEADAIANSMLESQNYNFHLLVDSLPSAELNSNDWLNDLQISKKNLQLRLRMQDAS
jgi:Zn-dependent protease with chaperone function